MKRILAGLISLTLLCACTAQGAEQKQTTETTTPTKEAAATATSEIWKTDKMPVKVEYARMWEYSASGSSEDAAYIEALVDAIKRVKVGEPTDMATEDYTDVVLFTFEGEKDPLRLEFENQCWVKDQKTRYEVEGLRDVRQLLDQLIDEEQI